MLTRLGQADPHSFIAGPDALQTQAGTAASGLTASPLYGDAASLIRGSATGPNTYNPATGTASHATGASLLDNLPAYMSPYTNDVVNTSLAGFDDNAGRTRASQMLDLAGDSTFGGSGGSILRSQTEGQLGLSRGQLEAGLRDQAFNTGASLSGQDADRRQQTSQFNAGADNTFGLANMDALNTAGRFNATAGDAAAARSLAAGTGLGVLGAQEGADQRANIDTQSNIGSILQALAQQKAGSPLALAQGLTSMWGGLPLNAVTGHTTDGTMTGTGTSNSKESGATLGRLAQLTSPPNAQAAARMGRGG
jgi:hypothetical protein